MTLCTKQGILPLLMIVGVLMTPARCADFYTKHAEGWFWYQNPPIIDEDTKPKKQEATPTAPESPSQKAQRHMAAFKKKLDDAKVMALIDPTPHNVETYMRVQKEMVDRSEHFSKTWQQMVLTHSDLNPEVKNPTAQYARHVQNDMATAEKTETITRLSKTYGLIYFFKSNCPYCTNFAPIVQMFADKYNWSVLAISLDGSASEVFKESRPDNGIAQALDIKSVPALIAYNGETNDIIPISYAMTSLDQLENNVMALVGDAQ